MDVPRRERRHHHHNHRKAAAATAVQAPGVGGMGIGGGGNGVAAAARAAYGDVFGGPPRYAAPFGGAPADYAEVFGGVAATCSIPFLDLPPVAVADDYGCGGGGGGFIGDDYGEIFGRFDFGDFAAPYEELFGGDTDAAAAVGERGVEAEAEEIASSSGSSSSSMKKESTQPDVQPFMLPQHFKEHEPVISFPPNNQQFVMSYNKATQRSDDLVEMTTCMVDSSVDYVVDSQEFSHVRATNHVSTRDNGREANREKKNASAPSSANVSLRSPESDFTADQKQHIPACPSISENVSVNENHQNPNIISTPSNGTPSPDYAFLRVSDANIQTQMVKPPPPLKQQSKFLKKREIAAKGDVHLENQSFTPPSSAHVPSSTGVPQVERRDDTASFNTEANPSSAAAAMKEAMEYAEARLKAAKELMERKGDSFKLRKKPSHHRSTRSTEIKVPTESDTFGEKLSVKKSTKEEINSEDSLLDKHQKDSAARIDHCDESGKRLFSLEKPQHIMQSCTAPNQTSTKLGKLGNWTSGDEFYELTGEEQKQKTDTAVGEEDKCGITNHVTKPSKEQKGEVTAAESDLERYEKLWEDNDGRDVGVKHVTLREEDNTSPTGKNRVPTVLESSTENVDRDGICNSHFNGPAVVENTKENHDGEDVAVEHPCKSGISISEPNLMKDMPSSFQEASSSGKHATDFDNDTTEESSVAGTSQEPKSTKRGLEAACDVEMQCTAGGSEKLQEPPEITNIDSSRARQIKSLILEDLEGSYESQTSPKDFDTAGSEAETDRMNVGTTESYGREKVSFVEEPFMHNANGNIAESPFETAFSEQVEKVETEERVGSCTHSDESIVDKDDECSEEVGNITSENSNSNLPYHEDSSTLNIFEAASKLIQRDLDQEKQDTLQPGEVETRTVGPDGFVLDSKDKDAKENPSGNSDKTGTEEVRSHDNQEDQKVPEMDKTERQSDVNAQGNVNCYEDEGVITAANNCTTGLTTNSIDQVSSSLEMETGRHHLPQDAGPAISRSSKGSSPSLEKTEEFCKEAGQELQTEKSAVYEEENSWTSKVAEKLRQQQSHLEKSSSLPKSAEGHFPSSADISRKEAHGVQKPKERGSLRTEREREKDKETSRRLEETKEREKKFEKEREIAEERERKKLEEQEREREREKDRLAVERATREAHERAFAEARERAEKMALEKAREKEERASAEGAAERAARIKAERAAVERATTEARERAIEKAKAEKAAAEARERRERYRSSFKDNQQDTQFQRATSSNIMRNPDSYSKGLEVESALRHKARLERHQRTTERVTKALAEKNMRDLLAQREQAEKHRLSEYLDPEIKRWSNGKAGNLRALLSTLQYILGADSGWKPVPLTELITAADVKKAYRKATLCVHPDKLQQRGATIRQKYICEKVFDLLKDAWNKFTSEER
uniref:J domain-containing protein n=1 Tax=Leersia perrieri TaxID=77586 RepID=A0A0D9WK60_9ORYZ